MAETDKARAFAGDFGLGLDVNSKIRLAASVQNVGSKLKFNDVGDDLPRIARAGASILLITKGLATTLFLDAPYHLNSEEYRPAIGLETVVGPMALRAGYKKGSDLEKFSMGTGLTLGALAFDYAFGLVDELDSRHRVSFSLRFGSLAGESEIAKIKRSKKEQITKELSQDIPSTRIFDSKDIGNEKNK